MQNAADGGIAALPEHHVDDVGSIVSELAALLDHVQVSMKAIEIAIAREASSGSPEYVDDVFLLDDVTPRYARAGSALEACNTSLEAALQFLREAETSAPLTKSTLRLVRPSGHA